MIKANELRLGNLVNDIEGTEYIFPIEPRHFARVIGGGEIYFRPIPMDEEWLKRMGFTRGYGWDYHVNIESDYPGDTGMVARKFEGKWSVHLVDIDGGQVGGPAKWSVHQVQNLYFALTGEELQIKPSCPDT